MRQRAVQLGVRLGEAHGLQVLAEGPIQAGLQLAQGPLRGLDLLLLVLLDRCVPQAPDLLDVVPALALQLLLQLLEGALGVLLVLARQLPLQRAEDVDLALALACGTLLRVPAVRGADAEDPRVGLRRPGHRHRQRLAHNLRLVSGAPLGGLIGPLQLDTQSAAGPVAPGAQPRHALLVPPDLRHRVAVAGHDSVDDKVPAAAFEQHAPEVHQAGLGDLLRRGLVASPLDSELALAVVAPHIQQGVLGEDKRVHRPDGEALHVHMLDAPHGPESLDVVVRADGPVAAGHPQLGVILESVADDRAGVVGPALDVEHCPAREGLDLFRGIGVVQVPVTEAAVPTGAPCEGMAVGVDRDRVLHAAVDSREQHIGPHPSGVGLRTGGHPRAVAELAALGIPPSEELAALEDRSRMVLARSDLADVG
mmetsp:Transcript_120906/g.347342  ORF Transcript_120906/g.347342 Transcript_120906/m.347342 type:complete len:422 (-) Transcript_120906:762-2027(-)